MTAAVVSIVAAQGISPDDKFRAFRVVEDNGSPCGIVTIAAKNEGETRELMLPETFLCAALLRLCLFAKIPMPRKASKKLKRAGESLALHLEFETVLSLDSVLNSDALEKTKEPKLAEVAVVDWWVTGPRRSVKDAI